MDKAYAPELHDKKWQAFWEKAEIGNPEKSHARVAKQSGKNASKHSKERFVLMMPPPNVTGVLHQGHALMLTLEDTLVRWERMRGKLALYLPGTDHASIAVNMQVVKALAARRVNYRDLGRDKFLEECWEWIKTYQPRIFSQIRALGVSCDWSRVKFTMDEDLNRAVTHAFVEFYKRGLIYRAQKLVNWCPKSLTVLSDLEVIFEERDGKLWHIRYPFVDDPSKHLVVATTRPETLLGDVAVAVHPDDERYKKWIGKKVRLPFTDREIPVIADSFVESGFGSGAVKITPAHDFADFEVGERHKLAHINIFTPDAKIVAGLPAEAASFAGLDRFEARKKMVDLLAERGQLEKEENYRTRIGISERAGVPVEPYLSTQWYCKMDGMAKNVVAELGNNDSTRVAREKNLQFIPHEFHNQFLRWMENIRDWCISRQLWWGQAIPAYHCGDCSHIEVSESVIKTCPKCKSSKVTPDADVLDTWFSSGIWPFSTLGWPDKTEDMKKFYPTQVLETGFDILFFWVARMLMMGKELTGELPFSKVYLHPMVRDEHGQKMSKSKGNVIDPLEIIYTAGADSLRMTLNALCVQGRDIRLSVDRIEGYRNFINKVWNATKFVLMESSNSMPSERPKARNLAETWIYARLDSTCFAVNRAWEEFRAQEAAETIYHFIWNDFCDWFVEVSKSDRAGFQPALLYVLNEALKLLHPICPHITEELWHNLPGMKEEDSLALELFPEGKTVDAPAEFKFLQDLVTSIRALRNESKLPLSKMISVFGELSSSEATLLKANLPWVQTLAKIDFKVGKCNDAHTVVTLSSFEGGKTVTLQVPLAELVNIAEEKDRLNKELENLQKYVASLKGKLSNESFVARAPAKVVEEERMKLKETEEKCAKMRENLAQLEKL